MNYLKYYSFCATYFQNLVLFKDYEVNFITISFSFSLAQCLFKIIVSTIRSEQPVIPQRL
jgi:hypothetical protein